MRKKDAYKQLVDRYIAGTANPEELQVFFHLLNKGKLERYLQDATPGSEAIVQRPPAIRPIMRYSAAAAVFLLLGLSAFLWRRQAPPKQQPVIANQFKNDIAPGGNKAILTLADGSTIVLDSAGKGDLARQGNTRIVKLDAGKLSYDAAGSGTATMVYNRISTPVGGQYQVTLPDGTQVWLNAMSSLRFPTAFNGDSREVELTGEAYFEVAKDKHKPFRVNVAGMQAEVLGTHFNVNAYPDEASVKTTLLEGSIRMVKGTASLLLRPGQQAQSKGLNDFLLIKDADTDQAIAWKNGHFSFEGADVHALMRQIARWYGVQVRYEGEPGSTLFGGEIGRDLSLAQVLTGLSKSKVHFRLEGTILTVLP
ncbi:MAG TPA: FecR family protein [Chitinophagaceae bacterium]